MAVLVSAGATRLTETNLSDVNGFFTSYAYNFQHGAVNRFGTTMGTAGVTTNLTIASNHNMAGVIIPISCSTDICDRDIEIRIEEKLYTVTISQASPCVVTKVTHGLSANDPISFSTTGALPSGLTAGTMYFVKTVLTADTFTVSATVGGTAINTNSAGSGTHSLWKARISQTYNTLTEFNVPTTAAIGDWIFDFKFTTPYAVTTTASTWRMNFRYTGGTAGAWLYRPSATSNPASYVTYNDTANATFSTGNDVLAIRNVTRIDMNATISHLHGTGDAGNPTSILICSNRPASAANVDDSMLLKWAASPAAPYTLTWDGNIICPTWGGFQIGTATNPIPIANKATLNPPALSIIRNAGPASQGTYGNGKSCLSFNGATATTGSIDTLAADAEAGQKVIVTTVDHSGDWASGDFVIIGKVITTGVLDSVRYEIDTIVGTTITLKTNITTNRKRLGPHTDANGSVFPGATICNISRHGVVASTSGTTGLTHQLSNPVHFQMHGVYSFDNCFNHYHIQYNWWTDPFEVKHSVTDCAMFKNTATYMNAFLQNIHIPKPGMEIKRVVTSNLSLNYAIYPIYSLLWNSGEIEFDDCHAIFPAGNQFNTAANANLPKLTVTNCSFENAVATFGNLSSQSATIEDNFFWGNSYSTNPTGAVTFNKVINPTSIARNLYSNNYIGWASYSGQTVNCVDSDSKFDATYDNTTDIYVGAYGLLDYQFNDPVGIQTINTTNITNNTPGSKLRFVPYSGTVNDQIYETYGMIQRCGDGLTDTTVHTSGSGKYSLRMESYSSTNQMTWEQIIPTGNIQNMNMEIGVWVKLNNSAYWAGTHELPRLTINYDNGTTVYCQAAESTEWQYLPVPFTPLTTYGSVTATLSTMTDATSTNRYVYFDDWSVLYPAGYIMDSSGMDGWANAEPVMPTISTLFSALDVWSAQTSTLTGTGTIGKFVTKLLSVAKFIGLK